MPVMTRRTRRDSYGKRFRDPWPQPSFTPQTAPGVALLDDFNLGATQLLTARVGWSPVGVQSAGEISWRTDATPTLADMTLTPATAHSNVWNSKFSRNQEVWAVIASGGGANSDLVLVSNMDANSSVGGNSYTLSWFTNSSLLQIQTSSAVVQLNIGAPAAGDAIALQREANYLFGWYKKAAGAWTYALAAVDATLGDGWIAWQQQGNGTLSLDSVGGGSFYTRSPHSTSGFRRTWAGRS